MKVKFHFWYKDCGEAEVEKEVDYIPDKILFDDVWWDKTDSAIDFDTGKYTKVHYKEHSK